MIDENKLIDELRECVNHKRLDGIPNDYWKLSELEFLISKQPKVNDWIPCSERLPNRKEFLKDNGRFVVTDGNRVYQSLYDIYDTEKFVTVTYLGNANFKSDVDNCVIAWQPLPEPYKGE